MSNITTLNFGFAPEYQLLREQVRSFAQKEIFPRAAQIDQQNIFPRDIWPALGKLGVLGVTVSEEYGGANLGYLAQTIVMEELSRASASVALSYGAHANLCVNQIFLNGTEQQKKNYLPRLISGEHVGALAMSEPEAGSDVMNLRCKAQKTTSGFLLTGNKMWITNGPDADIYVVYERTDLGKNKHGITAFIVERNSPGFSQAQKLDKLGMRGSGTCELVFNQCVVPDANVLGKVDFGHKVLMSGLDFERTVLAAGPVGIMQACLDVCLEYIHERKQFGQAIGEFQLIQAKIADMYTQLNASRAFLYSVAQACDRGDQNRKDAAAVILFTAENATQIALQAIQILGGNGYINDYPTGRFLRDAKLYEIGAGTSEIRRLLIGRELFKESE